MRKLTHIRFVATMIMVMIAIVMNAQSKSDITARINQKGNVTVQAPAELAKRSNSELNRDYSKKTTAKAEANADPSSLDEDKDQKKDEKREENRPPKRNYTSQQTIQSRGVGYRIQAFSDNNTATAKAAAQQRARTIAMKFPQYRSYISYNAPSWRLRIGDFSSQEEAQRALQKVRAAFPSYGREMIIVRDRINVWGN